MCPRSSHFRGQILVGGARILFSFLVLRFWVRFLGHSMSKAANWGDRFGFGTVGFSLRQIEIDGLEHFCVKNIPFLCVSFGCMFWAHFWSRFAIWRVGFCFGSDDRTVRLF